MKKIIFLYFLISITKSCSVGKINSVDSSVIIDDIFDCLDDELWSKEKAKWCCEVKGECNPECTVLGDCLAVYEPAVCYLENDSEEGSNMCEAKKKLLRTLCEKNKLDVDKDKMKCSLCANDDRCLEHKKKPDVCKEVSKDSQTMTACFPAGHICYDPHGIGDGVPTETDCWEGGGQLCHKGTANWPECAGGYLILR